MGKSALVFAGQGVQFPGMGRDLYETNSEAKKIFDHADQILGFKLSRVMFEGSAEELKETSVTQPALFTHALAQLASNNSALEFAGVAGHSLGEFTALVAAKVMDFESGLSLVKERADSMQVACDSSPGTMAAILGLDDNTIEEICQNIDGVVVAANFNSPGQLVISGEIEAVEAAGTACSDAGARRVVMLPVGGAFHSPLMQLAKDRLQSKIETTAFSRPIVPIYQNVTGNSVTDPIQIKQNLIDQLTGPVRWTQIIQSMESDGFDLFVECGGSGKVLAGLIRKINRSLTTQSVQDV